MLDVRIDVHDAVDITSVGAANVDDVRSEDVAVLLKPFQSFLHHLLGLRCIVEAVAAYGQMASAGQVLYQLLLIAV